MSSVNLQITKAENETLPLDRQTDVKDCWHYRSAKYRAYGHFQGTGLYDEKKRKRTKQEQIRTLRTTLSYDMR